MCGLLVSPGVEVGCDLEEKSGGDVDFPRVKDAQYLPEGEDSCIAEVRILAVVELQPLLVVQVAILSLFLQLADPLQQPPLLLRFLVGGGGDGAEGVGCGGSESFEDGLAEMGGRRVVGALGGVEHY
jgi:hypothetical protein